MDPRRIVPRYGTGSTLFLATEELEDGQRVALTLALPDNPAHVGGLPVYEIAADSFEEALRVHKVLNGFAY